MAAPPSHPSRVTLAIEMSNPSSGPRGRVEVDGRTIQAGPGVALGRDGELLGVERLHDGSRHDDDLMPAIDRLCGRCGVTPKQIARIAVSVGPGGYTSLRIAVATAKLIAEATGAQTIPIPSAAVAAWSLRNVPTPAIVCLASKGSSCFGTLIESPGAAHRELGLIEAPAIESLRPRTIIADRFLPDPIRAAAACVEASVMEPVFAAEAALRLSENAAPVDPVALVPLYPRQPEAVTLWQKRSRH